MIVDNLRWRSAIVLIIGLFFIPPVPKLLSWEEAAKMLGVVLIFFAGSISERP